jgi:hypothetical protein
MLRPLLGVEVVGAHQKLASADPDHVLRCRRQSGTGSHRGSITASPRSSKRQQPDQAEYAGDGRSRDGADLARPKPVELITLTLAEMAGKVRRINEIERPRRIVGPLTVVRGGCELERSGRSRSERSSHCSRSTATAHCPAMSSQRPATRIADAVRGLARAPSQDDMAIVVVQVMPAVASDVAA